MADPKASPYNGRSVWIGKRQYIDANELAKQIRTVGAVHPGGALDGSQTQTEISFSDALLKEWERTDEPRPGE